MGMDLCRDSKRDSNGDITDFVGESYSVNIHGWSWLFEVARDNGWDPSGTLAPLRSKDPDGWDGNYWSNDGQRVTDRDAAAWAEALERGKPYAAPRDSPGWVTKIDKFIAYCRGGGFEIH